MTSSNKFKLLGANYDLVAGYVDVPPVVDTFITPLFVRRGDNRQIPKIQVLDDVDRIVDFKAVTIDDVEGRITINTRDAIRSVGDQGIFGFYSLREGGTILGNRTQVGSYLSNNLSDFASNRFSMYEVLRFLNRTVEADRLFIGAELVEEDTTGDGLIGIVIVAHGSLAHEYLKAVEHVVGRQSNIVAVSIDASVDRNQKQAEIIDVADRVDSGSGVVIVTEIFGGSASNLSMRAASGPNRKVVYGANLPMLVKLAKSRNLPVVEAVERALLAGRKYIDSVDHLSA